MDSSKVRVRFAPSPTGFFHIGGARTALFNWLYAKHTGGTFVLRIEDTDENRDNPEFLRVIFEGLRWLGLDWDEGPEVGGNFGPYFQSQRNDIYKTYLDKLWAKDRLYEKDGAVWFRVSGQQATIHDAIRGDVKRLEEKDFVIIRSNGKPVFHFVNVVDDIDMGITHVIRGEDHLSNSSKHVEIFEALGAPTPVFAHIPLILKTVGSGKMSKRDRGALVEEYEQRHFLPEAVRNYLCLLGWSPKDDREILPIEEIIEKFDLAGINKTNARFDEKKMNFVNTEYLRNLPQESFIKQGRTLLAEAGLFKNKTDEKQYCSRVLAICQQKTRDFEGLVNFCSYFFDENFPIENEARVKAEKKENVSERVKEFLDLSQQLDVQEYDTIILDSILHQLESLHGIPTSHYFQPIRLAVSGKSVGPGIHELLEVLGKNRTEARIKKFLQN